MTLLFGISLFLSLATGFFLVRVLIPDPNGGRGALFFQLVMGAGLGIGISSCVYFLSMIAGMTSFVPLIDSLLCLLAGALAFSMQSPSTRGGDIEEGHSGQTVNSRQSGMALRSVMFITSIFRSPFPERETKKTGLEKLLIAVFSVELAVSCGAFFFAFLKEPHGRWDAWLIWNMHARFLARSGAAWREVFLLPMDWSHWDYPLLLPLAIVRGWKYSGSETIYIPAVVAFLFFLLTAGMLLGAAGRLKNLFGGLVAAMLLIATPFYILMGISQFADVPFSFFILTTIVMLSLPELNNDKNFRPLIVAGISAALAAWTKNEGILFFLVSGFVLFSAAALQGRWRQAAVKSGWFLAGALPIMLCVVYFKLRLAPPNDLTTGFAAGNAALVKLTDTARYMTIIKEFFMTAFNFTKGPVDLRAGGGLHLGAVNILLPIAWLWFMGVSRDGKTRPGVIHASAILGLMLSGYFAVYLLTPLPLEYHIATSLNRLFLQLWPSVIFLFFMVANAPDNNGEGLTLKPAAIVKNPAGKNLSAQRKPHIKGKRNER
jgi:hypothetical protein